MFGLERDGSNIWRKRMVTYLYGRDGQVAACRLYIEFRLSTRANENPWQSLGMGGLTVNHESCLPF